MTRIQILLLLACLVVVTSGCRSRGNNGRGWFAGNTTVAPPPTYSLNIPSLARNQPYYTPGKAPNNNTLNPNQSAPLPATQRNKSGWRQSGNQQLNRVNLPPAGNGSVLTSPTRFVETTPNNTNPGYPSALRTASLPGSGRSFTDSANYQTTQVDERRDATRLPATDASAVRAPAQFFPTGNIPQYQRQAPNYPPNNVGQPPQTFEARNGRYQQPNAYSGSMVMVNGQPSAYRGQPVLVNPGGAVYRNQTSSAPSVLAQSTTSAASGNAGQVGWRTRERNSDGVSRF